MKTEASEWYLHLLKDQMAYIVLHRRNILALELQARMINEKIQAEGGIEAIKAGTLNHLVKTWHDIIVSKSKLEKEIPYIHSMIHKGDYTPDQVKSMEREIIEGLPQDLQAHYHKEQEDRRKRLEAQEAATGGDMIDLSAYPKDTFII